MVMVEKQIQIDVHVLNHVARDILDEETSGVRVGPQNNQIYSKINLVQDTPTNQDTANAILNNWGELVVTADKTSMTEGYADPVVSCNDASIADDSDLGYVVLLDGEEYANGTDSVVGGAVSLTLSSPVAGVYDVYLYRLEGDYKSGSIRISVAEA